MLIDKGTGTGIEEDYSNMSNKMEVGGLEDVDGIYNFNSNIVDGQKFIEQLNIQTSK